MSNKQVVRTAQVMAAAVVAASVWGGMALGAVPSFPGANGAGAGATGGRGGTVYHVTSLAGEIDGTRNDPGTLAYGLNDANFTTNGVVQARTIVFDVGGTIWLGKVGATEGWDTQDPLSAGSNVTIAGQTAPGGITIMGGGLKMNGNNSIVRNLTIAPGYGTRALNSTTGYADAYVYDAMNVHATNVMVDHISTVFATDESISFDEFANKVSVQYSNISQGQNYPQADAENPGVYTGHALGSLIQPGSAATISIHHNLYAHEKGRLPRVGTETTKLTNTSLGGYNDFRDNVFYNWLGTGGSGASGQPSQNNFINNFWLAGPGGDDTSGTSIVHANGGTGIFSGADSTNTKVYQSGNLKDTNKDGDALDGVALTNSDFGSSSFQGSAYTQPGWTGPVENATSAYNSVLNYMGANWQSRNAVDTRIVNEVRTGTGQIMAFNDPTHGTEWNDMLALRPVNGVAPYSRVAGYDTDGDGMPNAWELANGTSATVADNNGDVNTNGYTNLEKFLNEVGAMPAPTALTWGGGTARFALIANWGNVWLPTRYDDVQINTGTATVDGTGQHAGMLRVGTSAGNSGTLTVTSGWIDVSQQLLVGPGGSGVVSHTGGTLIARNGIVLGGGAGTYTLSGSGVMATPDLAKTTGGVFSFTGGTLRAQVVEFDLVNNGGTIAPGSDATIRNIAAGGMTDINGVAPTAVNETGDVRVKGNLTMNSGKVEIEMASAALFDTLTVDGTLNAGGGTLTLALYNNYQPTIGATFKVINAGAVNGTFAAVTMPGTQTLSASPFIGTGQGFSVAYTPTFVQLTYTGKYYEIQGGTYPNSFTGSGYELRKTTAGVATLTGASAYSGPTTVSAGTLVFNPTSLAGTSGVSVGAGATASFTGSGNAFSLPVTLAGTTGAWTSRLDVNSSALIVATSNATDKTTKLARLADQIVGGKNGGNWLGNGITSSSVAANAATTTLAVLDNADLGLATFNGKNVNANSLIVTLALVGDANFDNNVDLADYDAWYGRVGGAGTATTRGDFNLDGQIDLADYDAWYTHVGAALPLMAAGSSGLWSVAAVPEPTTALLLAMPAVMGLARRRGMRRRG